jgi:glycolate oxidase FAD binding subunit
MQLTVDGLAQRLEKELDANTVKREPSLLELHQIDGHTATFLCSPATPEQVATLLRICSETNASVVPWGGGTAIRIGNLPRHIDVVVKLDRLNRLVEHDHANLTATVQTGMMLPALRELLAQQNQFLPFDPPGYARATVGGIVASNLNGPRRSYYGSVRDLVIGMKVVCASGEQIKAGGKVVKNVAGYDMCKLFVGSLGTLGIIIEVTLRVAPISETAATLIASGTLPRALQLADELSHSKLLPSAVVILNANATKTAEVGQSYWRVAVCCEGFEKSLDRHLHDLQEIAKRIGLTTEVLREKDHIRFWDDVREFPLRGDRLVYRVTVPRASAAEIIQTVDSGSTTDFRPEVVSDTAAGVVWISLDANDKAAKWFVKLIAEARDRRGHAIILAAPPNLKEGIDVWGPTPPSLSLMHEIKRQFDPQGLLNPGRFLARI